MSQSENERAGNVPAISQIRRSGWSCSTETRTETFHRHPLLQLRRSQTLKARSALHIRGSRTLSEECVRDWIAIPGYHSKMASERKSSAKWNCHTVHTVRLSTCKLLRTRTRIQTRHRTYQEYASITGSKRASDGL
jgi:hypothetical protein